MDHECTATGWTLPTEVDCDCRICVDYREEFGDVDAAQRTLGEVADV